MEEYLQNMKTLRSQMKDVEDEAAKISAEEETQLINIRTLENDIHLAVLLSLKLYNRLWILFSKRDLGYLPNFQRAYYSKVAEDMNAKLQKQQEWVNTKKINRDLKA